MKIGNLITAVLFIAISGAALAKDVTPAKARALASVEISSILDKLIELEETSNPSIADTYYPDKLVALENGRLTRAPKKSILQEIKRNKPDYKFEIITLKKPQIGVSEDASMAWAAVHQRKREIHPESGATMRTWEYTRLMVFQRDEDGDWQLVSVAKTDGGNR